ncbi:hypothetical protein E4U41_005249 [Claviceps citrina]|nr:hypothetical protein E4U41_005249 [Claviceps citrina]
MANKVLVSTLCITILFLATGALQLALSLTAQSQIRGSGSGSRDGRQTIRLLLYDTFPLTAGIIHGVLILASAAFALVGLTSPLRGWLKTGGYLVALCGCFSLCLGVYLWVMTLRLRDGFFGTYLELRPDAQSLVQQSFQCCGYYNASTPAFITDPLCSSPAAAALVRGCSTAISNFGNNLIEDLFTALFGMVGLDAVLILAIACLLKERKERERYRHIDEKSGVRTF